MPIQMDLKKKRRRSTGMAGGLSTMAGRRSRSHSPPSKAQCEKKISDTRRTASGERLMSISGHPDQIEKARSIIETMLAEARAGRCIHRSIRLSVHMSVHMSI